MVMTSSEQALDAAFAELQASAAGQQAEPVDPWETPISERRFDSDGQVARAPDGLPGVPQSPYVVVEDAYRKALATSRHASFEGLKRSLKPPHEIHQNERGEWVRTVSRYVPGASTNIEGVLHHQIEFYDRHVALSLEEARRMARPGFDIDHWNGFTWMRNGVKPELDFSTIQANQRTQVARLDWVPAPASEQAAAQAARMRELAVVPAVPSMTSEEAAEVATVRRGPGRPRKEG